MIKTRVSATARAHPNIALIKYWGKKDEKEIIPVTSSISLTLAAYKTETTVTLDSDLNEDVAFLNGSELRGNQLQRVVEFLQIVRELAGKETRAQITSFNTVPTAAGLASSASGFAALAVAAAKAYGLNLPPKELSKIARKGSGSASRSLFGGMVLWNGGDNDETSYAEQLEWGGEEIEMLIAVISSKEKSVSSREAMQITAKTSPFYENWITANSDHVTQALAAIKDKNLLRLGELTELSTMRMHAVMLAADPAIRYLEPKSLEVLDRVKMLRERGLVAYATADAGPNIKILSTKNDSPRLLAELQKHFPALTFLRSAIGGAPEVIEP